MARRLLLASCMWTEQLSAAYEDATDQQRAGFVAYLVTLAPKGTPIMPELLPALTSFTNTAGLEHAKSIEERQARMDAYYAKYPLSAALRLAFERSIRSSTVERGLELDHGAAARRLGLEATTLVAPPVERSVAVSGLLALRAGASQAVPNPQRRRRSQRS